MKKIFTISLFVISLVFLSCSSAFDGKNGKIELTLPSGTVRNVRAAGLNASETEVETQYYSFYIKFTSTATLEEKIESGQSGDRVIVEDIEPGVWTITALACEVENKKYLEEYIRERGDDAFINENNSMGYDYFKGQAKAQVVSGQTSNVALTMRKVLQENEIFTGITVTLPASEEKITFKNYDRIMQQAVVSGNYETWLGAELISSSKYDIPDFTYTKLEPNEIGYKPVIFTSDDGESVYNTQPVIVPVYYDLTDYDELLKVNLVPESEAAVYSVTKGEDFTLDVAPVSDSLSFSYYPEGSFKVAEVNFVPYTISSKWAAGEDELEALEDSFAVKINTEKAGDYSYMNTSSYGIKSDIEEANAFILSSLERQIEVAVNVLEKYKVTFVSNYGEKIVEVIEGQSVDNPGSMAAVEGFIFEGWFTDNEYEKEYDFTEPVTDDLILYGKWSEIPPDSYTVTFIGEYIVEKSVLVNAGSLIDKADIPSADVEDYTFEGWFTDKSYSDSTKFDFETAVTDNLILYGYWKKLPEYRVTFVYNGKADEVTVIEGKTVSPNPIDETEGYSFDGWYTNKSFSGEKYDFTTPVKTNLMLYARNIPIEYTITYILDDGTNAEANPAVYTIESGRITLLDPSKDGYDFTGWIIKDEVTGENIVVKEIAPTTLSDITLTASWKLKSFKITFVNAETDKEFAEQYVDYLGKVTAPGSVIMEGYTFKGWYADKDLTKEFDFDTPVVSELTIYGKWIANSNSGVNVDFPEEPVTGQINFTLTAGDEVIQPGSAGYYIVEQGEIIIIKADFNPENPEDYNIYWSINGEDPETKTSLLEFDTSEYLGYAHIVCSVEDAKTKKIIFTGNLNVAVIQ